MDFTQANFLTLIRSAEGTPYKFGGIEPFRGGADCSGLIFWAGQQCGTTLPRTTQAEWAGLPHVLGLGGIKPGDIVEFEVPGDGGSPPQHVGVWIGPGTMIDDPHTGAVVSVQSIPTVPGVIWPYGYCRLPFVSPPQPSPTPLPEEEEMPLYVTNSQGTGFIVATDLSHKVGLPDAPDAKVLQATSLYKVIPQGWLTDQLIASIPNV